MKTKTNNQPEITILVATCNRPEMLKKCLESLVFQKTKTKYEIIVLDQSDSTRQIYSFSENAPVKIVSCDFQNKSKALNIGIKKALADYIAIIDDDCIAEKGWIENIYKSLKKEGGNAIVTGRVIAGKREENSVISRLHDDIEAKMIFQKNIITPIFKLSGCNFGFHKSVYEVVGAFDENFGPGSRFKSSDDNEWSYRALNLGYQIIYLPNAIVIHHSWRNAKEDIKLLKDYGYAAGAFFKLIFRNSKIDFIYHTTLLWLWLFKAIVFSFNAHEIKGHIYYGISFLKGFLDCKQHYFNRFFDCIFLASPGQYIGGAERYTQNIATKLKKRFKVIIAVSHNKRFYLECKNIGPAIYLGNTLWEASRRLLYFLKSAKVKVLFSNGYHSSYLVFLVKEWNLFKSVNGCRFVDIKHGWITTNFAEQVKTFLDKLIALFFHTIIVVNPSMKRKLWFINKKKIIFIPSAIQVTNKVIVKNLKANQINILLIGRLSKEKRFDLVIKALSYLHKNLWKLTIVGDGPEMNNLKQLISLYELNDKVNFVGYQANTTSFYKGGDLLIISSINEGCPLVALEAMSFGVLVLSTRVGYMTTLLDKKRGFLIDINTNSLELSKIIRKITKLDHRKKEKIIKNAHLFVHKNHNIINNVKLFEDLINGDDKV